MSPLGLAIFHLDTKFGAKMWIDAEIIVQNRNLRWRPSAILDLLHHHIGPTTKSFHRATSACQILCKCDAWFWRYGDLNFLQIWLEMHIHAPNFGFWGSEPLNVIGHHRDSQKAHPWNRTYMRILVQIGPLVRPVREMKESKKKGKERNLQWQTGCSRRPPTLTQRYVVLHAG